MRKGQQKIALGLLGLISLIAIIGLVVVIGKPSGEFINPEVVRRQPTVISNERINWNSLFAFASSSDVPWCAQNTVAQGGFSDLIEGASYTCFTVSETVVPEQYKFNYRTISMVDPAVAACFFNQGVGSNVPIVCRSS